jgi:hypothetical protein
MLLSPMRATYFVQPILFDLIILIIFGRRENYEVFIMQFLLSPIAFNLLYAF